MASNPTNDAKSIDLFVAQRLKIARKQAGLSQTNAGNHIGKAFQQIQKYERGTNRIGAGAVASLASLYHKPVAWFFPDERIDAVAAKHVDLIHRLLITPSGVELAKYFLDIDANYDREIVVIMAATLARKEKS